VRSALSLSKKLGNHVGAIKLFICHDNLTRAMVSGEPYLDITTFFPVALGQITLFFTLTLA
jgi:hypothetical protein